MSIGSINSKPVNIEKREEQENCSLDVYCTVLFTPYPLSESQSNFLLRSDNSLNDIELKKASYIGDIHCQRVVYDNCIKPSGYVIESEPMIIVDCSDISSQMYLDENTVQSKISLARLSIQNVFYKYIGYRVTFHIGVFGFTLTEDIAKSFSYNLSPIESLLPEDLGLSSQLNRSLKCRFITPFNMGYNLDFVIVYDTFPVVISNKPNLSEDELTLTTKQKKEIKDKRDVSSDSDIESNLDRNQNFDESYTPNSNNESPVLLVGGISHYEYKDTENPHKPDKVQTALRLINPLAAILYSANKQFINYIQTDEGKIWWDGVSDNVHFVADTVRDNANALSGWLFNAAMGGYAVAGTIWVGSGFVATPASALIATGSSLILFGSGVASAISSVATVADMYTYIYDYISDPINNEKSLNEAFNLGSLEIQNYIIGKIAGSAGKKIQSKIPKKPKQKLTNKEQLKRQKDLLNKDQESLNKKKRELFQLELNEGDSKNPSKRRVSSPSKSAKYKTRRKKLLDALKNIQQDINNRGQQIQGLHIEIIKEQSSSKLEDIFSNVSGGIVNKWDKEDSIDNMGNR